MDIIPYQYLDVPPVYAYNPRMKTIRDFLRWGMSQMNAHDVHFGHGTENSEDEAMLLVSHALHLPYPIQAEYWSARLTSEEMEAIQSLFHRRIQERVPALYLTHQAWFAGLPFYVDERVLIPRSPIAELIEQQFLPWIDTDNIHRVLDLCTGSGCIAIACAYAFPEAHVDAVDISPEALAVAQKNNQEHHTEDTVSLILSNMWSALPPENQYDIIVSNPPYVGEAEFLDLPKEYTHEPALALLTEKNSSDGLECVDEILRSAKKYLSPHGILVVEVGNAEEALMEKYPEVPFLWLDFERGGSGVFLLTAEQLADLG